MLEREGESREGGREGGKEGGWGAWGGGGGGGKDEGSRKEMESGTDEKKYTSQSL